MFKIIIIQFELLLLLLPYRSFIYQWGALVTACCLVFSVQLGIQTLPHLLSGELFPSDVRAFCKGKIFAIRM